MHSFTEDIDREKLQVIYWFNVHLARESDAAINAESECVADKHWMKLRREWNQ